MVSCSSTAQRSRSLGFPTLTVRRVIVRVKGETSEKVERIHYEEFDLDSRWKTWPTRSLAHHVHLLKEILILRVCKLANGLDAHIPERENTLRRLGLAIDAGTKVLLQPARRRLVVVENFQTNPVMSGVVVVWSHACRTHLGRISNRSAHGSVKSDRAPTLQNQCCASSWSSPLSTQRHCCT